MRDYDFGGHYSYSDFGPIRPASSIDLVGDVGATHFASEVHFYTKPGFLPASEKELLYGNENYSVRINAYNIKRETNAAVPLIGTDGTRYDVVPDSFYSVRIETEIATGAYKVYLASTDFDVEIDTTDQINAGFDLVTLLYELGRYDASIMLNRAYFDRKVDGEWVPFIEINPSLVSDGSGEFVPRGDASAEAGSDVKVYDTVSGYVFNSAFNDPISLTNFENVKNVNNGTIELGETGATVTMSNPVTPTDLYFTDGNKEYRPTYSQSGATFTFDVPLTSDDTLPKFGTLDLVIVDADGTYSKSFEFVPPAGYTLVTLKNPIELDESSYTFGTGLNPIAGDFYFHQPTTDFSINVNNVWSPVGDAPWSHAVWYLSGAGLRETTVRDGQVAVDPSDPPTVDAGAPRSITVPDAVQLGTNVTANDSDGTIASYAWTQESGPTSVSINNAGVKNASVSLTEAGTYVFRVTVTDNDGATAFDDLTVTANEAVTDSTLNLTVTGIGSSTEQVVLHDRADNSVVYTGSIAFTNDVGSVTLTGVDVGTEIYGVWFGTNPPVTGTGIYGVTE